jgi:hypothetical protein
MQHSTTPSRPAHLDPFIVVVPNEPRSLIHIDFLEEAAPSMSIKQGALVGYNARLECDIHIDFCDIHDLGEIPNIALNEQVEIYDNKTFAVKQTVQLKDVVTCPCVLQTQRIYAIDFSRDNSGQPRVLNLSQHQGAAATLRRRASPEDEINHGQCREPAVLQACGSINFIETGEDGGNGGSLQRDCPGRQTLCACCAVGEASAEIVEEVVWSGEGCCEV